MTDAYDTWIGRRESRTERIHASVVQAMAATVGVAEVPQGAPLPPGWQWLFFNPVVARGGLGADGHPRRGGFLPPIELPRRMWAGSRLQYRADLPVGAEATRHSRILDVKHKTGRQGELWFVTVEHTTEAGGVACIVEEQDVVYREAAPAGLAPAPVQVYDGRAQWGRVIEPDTVLLFRYSALTFNGHRIHYDQDYVRHEEGYPDLVVHGPLTATLLQQLALEQGGGRPLARFDFRGVGPLFVSRPFRIEGRAGEEGTLSLWARGPDGELAVSAVAAFR